MIEQSGEQAAHVVGLLADDPEELQHLGRFRVGRGAQHVWPSSSDEIIDARLADGPWVALCAARRRRLDGDHHPPLRRPGLTIEELIARGSLAAVVAEETAAVLGGGRNVLISGSTGCGKTTLLSALVSLLPAGGRVISTEDTLEARLRRTNGLRFEACGRAGRDVAIGDLVRHALGHRPGHQRPRN